MVERYSSNRSNGEGLSVERLREDFPILRQQVHGRPLVYLDNAATTQKPQAVIDALIRYYTEDNANIHRGVHALSVRATRLYESARRTISAFLGACEPEEIVFVRGATEGVNLVAQSWARPRLARGDEILITGMEHHSNIVPWQIICRQTGAVLRVAPIDDHGALVVDEYERMLSPRTKVVALAHVSNALGTINPVQSLIRSAHSFGAVVLVDGAQAVPHQAVDVAGLDCDFYVFSSHKVYGPTGVGALYGRRSLLEQMEPYQGGGEMIRSVTFEETTYNDIPYRFEAGTPNISGAIGLGAAIEYLKAVGMDWIAAHETDLLAYATESLKRIEPLRIIGTAPDKAAVISFVLPRIHAHDVGTVLDRAGVAVRTGHHCAQPIMDRFGVPATTRASFALYNTRADVDALVAGLEEVLKVFG
ncbi:MAG: cysteine desulfurase [Phycisphaerae bacterium]|nr:cysteine desulfurase [Phycisphaerae bacterium]